MRRRTPACPPAAVGAASRSAGAPSRPPPPRTLCVWEGEEDSDSATNFFLAVRWRLTFDANDVSLQSKAGGASGRRSSRGASCGACGPG